MMSRQRGALRSTSGAMAILATSMSLAWGQGAPGQSTRPMQAGGAQRPEAIVQNAMRANPVTAPYPIIATWRDGKVVLSGRVGTKLIHDAAVRMAIDIGFPFRDDLVIDTAETFRVAMSSTPSMTGYAALAPNLSASYYVYPPPLFGRLDDPFFGMVPPLVSFPPWWGRQMEGPMAGPNVGGQPTPNPMINPNGGGPAAPNSGGAPAAGPSAPNPAPAGANNPGNALDQGWNPQDLPPAKGDVEITVDSSGQVILQGVVASEEVARELEQTARSVPGVTRVVTRFQVKPRPANQAGQDVPPPLPQPVRVGPGPDALQVKPRRVEGSERDAPPPPPLAVPAEPAASPQPAPPPEPDIVPARHAPSTGGVSALDGQRLTRRVVDSLKKRPAVGDLAIKVRSTGDAVMLTGQVPSAYEAMIAYRSAQQTPGVRDVVDRLEFVVPDEDHPNPLVQKGRPGDIEPYLNAQMSRHVGELAHIDSVKAHGDHLEIQGTLLNAADRDRVLAIIRSIPVLHGFRLDPNLTSD